VISLPPYIAFIFLIEIISGLLVAVGHGNIFSSEPSENEQTGDCYIGYKRIGGDVLKRFFEGSGAYEPEGAIDILHAAAVTKVHGHS